MPLRLIEIVVPTEELERVEERVREEKIVDLWTAASESGSRVVRILLNAEEAESVLDLLTRQCGAREGFRVILLSVEATVPPVEETQKEEPRTSEPDDAAEGPQRISREELYEDVAQAAKLTPIFLVTVVLSTIVAAVGLIRGDIAVIIGAMVIAPLLGPNVALALASALGDPTLARRSLQTNAVGAAVATVLSVTLGILFQVDPQAPEIAARTSAGLGDIILALSPGAAGTLAFTTGVPAAVVGVMVAVALLPPLVVAGLLIGSGHPSLALGALLLILTNVTCVNLAAVATFLVQKVRPRTWWEAERAKKATRLAVTAWILMLALLVGLILSGYIAV